MAKSDTKDPGKRYSSAEADAWLGRKIPCLDHGFVYLVDYMGGDPSIVQAARVSYGLGTKSVSEDRGLIRYLMRHLHTTPFEMVDLKFHVKLPIFVARQWIRHRTACLTGETELAFDMPCAVGRGERRHHQMRLDTLHRLWHRGTTHPIRKRKPLHLERVVPEATYTVPELSRLVERREEDLRNLVRVGALHATRRTPLSRKSPSLYVRGSDWHDYATRGYTATVPMRERVRRMWLRMCDESTGAIGHTNVVDVWQTGVRPVYRVTLQNGYCLTMTRDHRCLTERGWMTLGEATSLRRRDDGGVTWDGAAPAFAVNGMRAYRDPSWLADQRRRGLDIATIAQNGGTSYHNIRKYLKVHGLQYTTSERSRLSGLAQRGQRRTLAKHRVFTEEHRRRVREARSGPKSNFWKGGVTPERANVARWTREQAAKVHAKYGYRCVICAQNSTLHAHHLDPVWNNPPRAWDIENLATLCRPCHARVHHHNLEIEFMRAFAGGDDLHEFWDRVQPRPRPVAKRAPMPIRLVRTYSAVKSIEYVGERMTYDLEVSGPYHNFVANGFIVHNSVNEYSGRYSIMPDEFYVPPLEQVTVQSPTNRQGGGESIGAQRAAQVLDLLRTEQRIVREGYDKLLEWDVRRELARINLGVAQYTEWYWKANLWNVIHFLKLRLDAHAQYEIRVYAEAMAQIVKAVAPVAWEAFEDYQLQTEQFSRLELETLARIISGVTAGWPSEAQVTAALPEPWRERTPEGSVKRNREREEFIAKLKRLAALLRSRDG